MRNKKAAIIGSLTITCVLIISIIFFFAFKEEKEIQRFEKEFGLAMPEETRVIFSEDDHGALGDGTLLYIYQLSPTGMDEFVRQERVKHWPALPFDGKLSAGLMRIVKGVSAPEISNHMRFDSKNGYYLVRNRYDKPLKGYDFQDISYSNIIIAIVDLGNKRIYYFTCDM
jgi:hypothetical protein